MQKDIQVLVSELQTFKEFDVNDLHNQGVIIHRGMLSHVLRFTMDYKIAVNTMNGMLDYFFHQSIGTYLTYSKSTDELYIYLDNNTFLVNEEMVKNIGLRINKDTNAINVNILYKNETLLNLEINLLGKIK